MELRTMRSSILFSCWFDFESRTKGAFSLLQSFNLCHRPLHFVRQRYRVAIAFKSASVSWRSITTHCRLFTPAMTYTLLLSVIESDGRCSCSCHTCTSLERGYGCDIKLVTHHSLSCFCFVLWWRSPYTQSKQLQRHSRLHECTVFHISVYSIAVTTDTWCYLMSFTVQSNWNSEFSA